MLLEESTVSFWRGVKPGDMVTLSDAQTIIARIKQKKGISSENFEITEVLSAKQLNNLGEWRFFRLGETDQVLLAKIVDKNLSLYVLRDAPDWEPQTREELVNKELLFMFQTPDNPDNFEYEELRYVDQLDESNADVNGDENTIFYIKPQREQHAKADFLPAKSGMGQQIATIVEYIAESNKGYIDTELMFLELGTKASNGVLRLMVGRPIVSIDVNVMPRK